MKLILKILSLIGKVTAAAALLFVMVVLGTSVSAIYDFREPKPFEGKDIYNPYASFDSSIGWKRALFHCHTRVEGPFPLNECPSWPDAVQDTLFGLGYDIVTFSNHNEITAHPTDPELQVNVYEQGYNIFKYHKLVFGSEKVIHYDNLLPWMASQRQFEMQYLDRSSDFIQLNHPYRTNFTSRHIMECLSGYEITELDTGISTENEYWDWALSAGHYSFGLANDDLHHPERSWCVGVRCNFVNSPSGRYEDIRKTLTEGCFYAMRVPDYGNGDWDAKHEGNRNLPYIEDIGLRDSTIYIKLSAPADIRVTGQDHARLAFVSASDSLEYSFRPEDHYARITAFFPGGEVIYTNPFARYDSSDCDGAPFDKAPQKANLLLTILYNLALALLFAGAALLIYRLFKK